MIWMSLKFKIYFTVYNTPFEFMIFDSSGMFMMPPVAFHNYNARCPYSIDHTDLCCGYGWLRSRPSEWNVEQQQPLFRPPMRPGRALQIFKPTAAPTTSKALSWFLIWMGGTSGTRVGDSKYNARARIYCADLMRIVMVQSIHGDKWR